MKLRYSIYRVIRYCRAIQALLVDGLPGLMQFETGKVDALVRWRDDHRRRECFPEAWTADITTAPGEFGVTRRVTDGEQGSLF